MAHPSKSPQNHDRKLQGAPAGARARALRRSPPAVPQHEAAPAFSEPPIATDAWWLSRSAEATFARSRIPVADACARALRATAGFPGRLVVEFNGASFLGAALVTVDRHHELDLGDALARAMEEVLDEDDGLAIEVVAGQRRPTLAIQPYLKAVR